MAKKDLIFDGTFHRIAHQFVPMKSGAETASNKQEKKSTSHSSRRKNFIGKFFKRGEC
jgi:hypothetical protein